MAVGEKELVEALEAAVAQSIHFLTRHLYNEPPDYYTTLARQRHKLAYETLQQWKDEHK